MVSEPRSKVAASTGTPATASPVQNPGILERAPASTTRPRRLPLGATPRRFSYERRLRLWLAALASPSVLLCFALVYQRSHSWPASVGAALGLCLAWAITVLYLFDQLMRPLQTLSNVVAALREDDFSFRARGARRGDSLGDLALEINALAVNLQAQHASARDALSLLERVMSSMPSPVLAFGPERRLRLLNKSAEQVFAVSSRSAVGRTSAELGLNEVFELQDEAVFSSARRAQAPELSVPSRPDPGLAVRAAVDAEQFAAASSLVDSPPLGANATRWSVRRSQFRLNGVPHTLLVLYDVAAALREEERVAWQRLIRVLSHEINNSLTPIKSIAGSLRERLSETTHLTAIGALPPVTNPESMPEASGTRWEIGASERRPPAAPDHARSSTHDIARGLEIIEERAASLNRFLHAYQQLTRLPPPQFQRVPLGRLVVQVAAMETRLSVGILPGPHVDLYADPDQLQQLLINLLRNATEAALSIRSQEQVRSLDLQRSSDPRRSRGPAAPEVNLTWTASSSEVALQISDNGPGLANPANVFVPFYTTKSGGTGIGLVLARQIAATHRSSLTLTNRKGASTGCVAELRMPLYAAAAAQTALVM